MTGIYEIKSIINPKRIYIGSAINIESRWHTHISGLRKGNHFNKKLLNHANKYGIDDLIFRVINTCSNEELISMEQYYINLYKPYFNICKTAGSTLGIKTNRPKELYIRMGLNRRGEKHSYEHHRKIVEAKAKWYKPSDETKRKTSEALKGRIITDEHRKKIGDSLRGKSKSPESIKKRLSKIIGIRYSEEIRKKMGDSRRGKKRGSYKKKLINKL